MLSRLLKYDFRAMLKYWWIAALTSVALSVVGGACIVILDNEYNRHFSFQAIAGLGIFLVILGLAAFMIMSQILIYVRFYRHFYTDEGYLTFTLPVRRCDLLTSKVVTAVTVTVMTAAVVLIDGVIIAAISLGDRLFEAQLWERVWSIARDLWDTLGGYLIVYGIQFLLLMLVATVMSVLLLFCCITLAGIVVKKHKVLAAIGICYGVSGAISFVMQWVTMFGLYGVDSWIVPLPESTVKAVVSLALLTFTLFAGLVSVGLYLFNLWMIDRRLNLS